MPNNQLYDPSGTIVQRRALHRDFRSRLAKIRKESRSAVLEDDAFQLYDQRLWPRLRHNVVFDGEVAAEVLISFDDWFEALQSKILLGAKLDQMSNIVEQGVWVKPHIEGTYIQALEKGVRLVEDFGITTQEAEKLLAQPHFRNSLTRLEDLSYDGVKSIVKDGNRAVSNAVRQTMKEGFVQQKTPKQVGEDIWNAIKDRVDKVERWRCDLVARTDIVYVNSEATLDTFEFYNIPNVQALVEFATMMDDRVCPICSAIEGQVFTIQEARGLIPLHPQCRCSWLPAPEKKF